jgi:hypothetical protein
MRLLAGVGHASIDGACSNLPAADRLMLLRCVGTSTTVTCTPARSRSAAAAAKSERQSERWQIMAPWVAVSYSESGFPPDEAAPRGSGWSMQNPCDKSFIRGLRQPWFDRLRLVGRFN